MNKRNVRSFLYGVLFATCVIAVYYYFINEEAATSPKLDIESAQELLKNENYIFLTEQELHTQKDEAIQEAIQSLLNEDATDVAVESSNVTVFTLDVKSGMNATKISQLLKDNSIITSKDNFHSYLTQHGFSKKIQVGSYELNSNMTLEEIATIITTKKD